MTLLFALACTGHPDDATPTADSGSDPVDTVDAAVPFDGTPTWGAWDLFVHASDYDTCGFTTAEERADHCSRGCGTVELVDQGGGDFTISANFQDYVVECTLDDSGFLCVPLVGTRTVPDLDGVVSEWDAVFGVFHDATWWSGAYSFERSCEGSECAEVEAALGTDVDCVLVGRLEARLVE